MQCLDLSSQLRNRVAEARRSLPETTDTLVSSDKDISVVGLRHAREAETNKTSKDGTEAGSMGDH